MALTLLEASKAVQDPLRSGVIEEFARQSDLLNAMTFMDIPGAAYAYNRQKKLPGISFRGVNEGYTESTGIINPQVETLKIVGGDLDVDKFIMATMPERRSIEEAMQLTAIVQTAERAFIKGDSESSGGRDPDGMQKRLTGSQLITNAADGGALSLNKLDELYDAVKNPTAWIMNKAVRRRLTQASRNSSIGGFITYEQDAFGRPVAMYADLPILVIDDDDREVAVLPFNEVQGNTTTNTSIYCVSIADGHLEGIQNGGINVTDLGEIDDKPVMRTRIEWYCGFCLLHGRSAARLAGVQNAPVVI